MTTFKKCDRCGNEIEGNSRNTYVAIETGQFLYSHKYLDLCRLCSDELKGWMNRNGN